MESAVVKVYRQVYSNIPEAKVDVFLTGVGTGALALYARASADISVTEYKKVALQVPAYAFEIGLENLSLA